MSIGRNDPCPCGSGKKFKRCCGDRAKFSPEQSPTTLEAFVADAYSAVGVGDFRRAVKSALSALSRRPKDIAANHICGIALTQLGDLQAAARYFELACSANPAHPQACSNLGYVRERLGDHDGAESACLRALAQDPNLADAHNNLGNVMRARGRSAEAITRYRLAVQLAPDDPSYAVNLANSLLQNGEIEGVERLLVPFTAASKPFAPAYSTLGLAYLLRGKAVDAVKCFERADVLNPNDPQTLVNLAVAQGQLRLTAKAVTAYERAFSVAPTYLA